MQLPRIPTTVFTGFLGSGKTTIIANIIEQLQQAGTQVVYIKNEIGAENIDAEIMRGKHITSRELVNGCICCTLVGPFITSINEVIGQFSPDRIIIEASGAADPAAIALMIDGHPKLERDGVISIIDVINFSGYKDLSTTARNQTKFTDLIVFNKVEQVDLEQKRRVVGYVRELNATSPIIEAPNGTLDPNLVFGVATTELDALLATPHDHSHHLTQDGLESIALSFSGKISEAQVRSWIEKRPNSIFRIKGIIALPSGEMKILNTVGARTTFSTCPPETKREMNSLVLIGFKLAASGVDVMALNTELEKLTQ
ncbi:MAG: GTP-binding protein [bacterium]|nr:GTP-binding protein [bacterium]